MMAGMARQLPPIEAPLIEADAAHLRRC
jgi:hypothetical protein